MANKAEELIKSAKIGDVIRYIPTVGEVKEYEILQLSSKFEPGFKCYKHNENCIVHVPNHKIREKINKLQLVGGVSG